MKTRILLPIIQILFLFTFVLINLNMVFKVRVCCADDAFHAHVAKNLAGGLGFATTLPGGAPQYTVTAFDPWETTGPTIILPAALMIRLVGNTYWAPGVTVVVLWTVLLLGIGILLNQLSLDRLGLTLGTAVFFFFAYTLMFYHRGHWFALLGEVPAALALLLGILLYFQQDAKLNLVLSGLLLSCAVQAKVVALLPVGVFGLWVVIDLLVKNKGQWRGAAGGILRRLAWLALGFLLPLILFEVWKLAALESAGYLAWWKTFWKITLRFGLESKAARWQLALERVLLAREQFGVYLPVLVLLFAWMGIVLRKDKGLMALFLVLAAIIGIYTLYWLFFSIGWARYYIICLVLMIFLLPFPFLSAQVKPGFKWVHALLLAGLSFYNFQTVSVSNPFTVHQPFQPNADALALAEVRDMLSARLDERPFLTEMWATAVDVEYMMDSHLNFTTISDPGLDLTQPYILVINQKFMWKDDTRLSDLLTGCETEEIGPYLLGMCNQAGKP